MFLPYASASDIHDASWRDGGWRDGGWPLETSSSSAWEPWNDCYGYHTHDVEDDLDY